MSAPSFDRRFPGERSPAGGDKPAIRHYVPCAAISPGVRLMGPGLVTVFLLQFIAIWNNFLLPFVMLTSDDKYPLTVGLYNPLRHGAAEASLYSPVITGTLLSVPPVIALFLSLQRFWRIDLVTAALK